MMSSLKLANHDIQSKSKLLNDTRLYVDEVTTHVMITIICRNSWLYTCIFTKINHSKGELIITPPAVLKIFLLPLLLHL